MVAAMTSLAAVLAILDLIGNSIVIHVIRARTPTRTTIDLLIANLAAADLLMIPVIAYLVKFFFVQFDWFGGIAGQITCRLAMSVQALSVLGSVYTIFAISVDRCCAVFFPLKKIVTKKRVKLSILLIWLIAIAFAIPECLAATVVAFENKYICVPTWENSGISSEKYTVFFVVLSYFFPLVAIATLYLLTGVRLWKSIAPGHHSEERIERMRASRRKPTKMLISIVVVFALCWLPLQAAEVLRRFTPEVYWLYIPFKAAVILPWFGVANSAINPFIYPIFCEKFRFEFKRVLLFRCLNEKDRRRSDLAMLTGLVRLNGEGAAKEQQKMESNTTPTSSRSMRTSLITSI